MNDRILLLEWIKKFDSGEFNNPNIETQIQAGWFDWFCKEQSLRNRTKTLGKKVKLIINSPKLNPKRQYLLFKNICPGIGNNFDNIFIVDINTEKTMFIITPKSGHLSDNGNGYVLGQMNNFTEALIIGTWKEIKNWFNS